MTRLGDSGDERQFGGELARIEDVYRRRAADERYAHLYAPFSPAPMFTVQEREWAVGRLMRMVGLESLADLDILDVGCGSGVELLRFVLYGAAPERLAGIDLMPDRAAAARRLLPEADIRDGSAHRLPYADATFDIVSQFTVFSSIQDPGLRAAVAAEMRRVARPGGLLLWYDVRRLPRRNTSLVAIPEREIRELFPGGDLRVIPVTLQWGLVHRVLPRSRFLGELLGRLRPLTSHHVAVIRMPKPVSPTT